ncbi:(2Fe-2S) ferredoxin domain-containing protein [Candidatus Peregrinibacteria bacterium]|nr:(2Fe-2S) ferredoxin domain-containing protein [Candidatus Peregrinibacteria bacterium]
MKISQNKYRKQLFVCCNTKKDGTGCATRGGEELRAKLKEKLHQHPGLISVARVNRCGCMDFCNDGIAVQIQPADKLLLDCTPDDAEKIWEEFLEA